MRLLVHREDICGATASTPPHHPFAASQSLAFRAPHTIERCSRVPFSSVRLPIRFLSSRSTPPLGILAATRTLGPRNSLNLEADFNVKPRRRMFVAWAGTGYPSWRSEPVLPCRRSATLREGRAAARGPTHAGYRFYGEEAERCQVFVAWAGSFVASPPVLGSVPSWAKAPYYSGYSATTLSGRTCPPSASISRKLGSRCRPVSEISSRRAVSCGERAMEPPARARPKRTVRRWPRGLRLPRQPESPRCCWLFSPV